MSVTTRRSFNFARLTVVTLQKFVHLQWTGNRATDALYLLLWFHLELVVVDDDRSGVLRKTVEFVTITALGDDLVNRINYNRSISAVDKIVDFIILLQTFCILHFPIKIVNFLQLSVNIIELTVS